MLNISRGSAVMYLSCDGIFNNYFIAYFIIVVIFVFLEVVTHS